MKNRKLFQKIVFIALILAVLISLVAPAIFAQTTPPQQEKLLNGLKVMMWPDVKAENVRVRIRIHSGSAFDPQGKEGLMQMLAANIFPNEASREFFAEDLGGSLDVRTTYDHIEIDASSKPENLLTMLETLSTAVANPVIDKETTARLRTAQLTQIGTLESKVDYVADRAAAARLLGTFPYGRPLAGTPASVTKIDFADLVDARQRFLTADNATIAVSGNFERSLIFKAIRRYFGGWLKADKKIPATFRQPDQPPIGKSTVSAVKSEFHAVRFATRGVARSDKDFHTAAIFAAVLQNRLKAKLTGASDVFAKSEAFELPGTITLGFSVPVSTVSVVDAEAVAKLLADPVTESEFQTAFPSVRGEHAAYDNVTRWLDAETYGISDPAGRARSELNISLTDVNSFADKVRKQPLVNVVVTSAPVN